MSSKIGKTQPSEPYRAVVLFSSGLDSLVSLALLASAPLSQVESIKALIFNYKQSNVAETNSAVDVCLHWRIPFQVAPITMLETDTHKEIPGRNLVFIAHAFALAQAEGYNAVAIGADPDDIYPDSSSAFLVSMDQTLHTLGNYSMLTPVKYMMSKQAVVRAALSKGAPLHLCHSSYSNIVDGNCRPSKAFLDGLASLIPIHPKEALSRLDAFHQGDDSIPADQLLGNPDAGTPPFDGDLLRIWSLKQAFSTLPRPRYCEGRRPPEDHPVRRSVTNVRLAGEALRSLGYAAAGEENA